MISGALASWLASLADPVGPNLKYGAQRFEATNIDAVDALIDQAARHNVHLTVYGNLIKLLTDQPDMILTGSDTQIDAARIAIIDKLREARSQCLASAMLVASVSRRLMTDLADYPVALVKGLDFAERAYGGLQFRSFGDADLLIHPEAFEIVSEKLESFGYTPPSDRRKQPDYTEWQWIAATPGMARPVLVELHTDMVHHSELRRRLSLTYDMYAKPALGGITPASRLVLAAIHGATSHLFGRLQYVVDGLMVARSGVDPHELNERAKQSGAALPLYTMLRLASDLFGCPTCHDLSQSIQVQGLQAFEKYLITVPMVLSAKTPNRWRLLPQRYAYRLLLRV